MDFLNEVLFADSHNLAARYKVASVSLEVFCAAIALVLAAHLTFGGSKKTHLNALFTRILILHSIMLVSDAMTWVFNGVALPGIRLFTIVFNYLGIGVSYISFMFFAEYIFTVTSEKRRIPRAVFGTVRAACLLCIAALTVSQFNGMFYFIDEQNIYHLGPWYIAMLVAGPVIMLFFSSAIVYYSKPLGKGDSPTFLTYVLFLPASAILQIAFPEFMFYYATYTLALLMIYVNIHIQHEELLQDRELELMETRISIMINQIQPHFLYSMMSVIGDLCRHAPNAAREAVIEFSRYLRANLEALTRKEAIPFDEEMRHVCTYLSLERKRFGEKIRVEYIIDASDFHLPPLTLQPIVENAIQHGIAARDEGGLIIIKAEDCGEIWRISVIDDGVGFDIEKKRQDGFVHTGLQNVRFRLDAMCGGSLDIDSAPGKGTEVVISIPKVSRRE